MSQAATPSDVASVYLQHGPYGQGHDPHGHGHADARGHGEGGPAPKRVIVGYGFWIFLLSDIVMFSAFFAAIIGFALIWHIWWLVALGLVGAYATFVVFAWRDEDEYEIPAEEVARVDRARRAARGPEWLAAMESRA